MAWQRLQRGCVSVPMGKACGRPGWHSTAAPGDKALGPAATMHPHQGSQWAHPCTSLLGPATCTALCRWCREPLGPSVLLGGPTLELRGPGGCCLLRLLWADESAANLRGGAQQAAARRGSRAGGADRLLSVKE